MANSVGSNWLDAELSAYSTDDAAALYEASTYPLAKSARPSAVKALVPSSSVAHLRSVAEDVEGEADKALSLAALLPLPEVGEVDEREATEAWAQISRLLAAVPPGAVRADDKVSGSTGKDDAGSATLSSLASGTNSMQDFLTTFAPLLSMQLKWIFEQQKELKVGVRLDLKFPGEDPGRQGGLPARADRAAVSTA